MRFADIRRWQSYVEPGDELESSTVQSPTKRISRNLEMLDSSTGGAAADDEELLPLPENTLTRNLGLDVIVVITKVRIFCKFKQTEALIATKKQCKINSNKFKII